MRRQAKNGHITVFRTRSCNKPRPLPGGLPCAGNYTEEAACNVHKCTDLGKISLPLLAIVKATFDVHPELSVVNFRVDF